MSDGWERVLAWCAENAPVTAAAVRRPAEPAVLTATRDLFRHPWPGELVEWFSVQDGVDESPITGNGPLPGWVPCSLTDVRRGVEDLRSMADEVFGDEVIAAGERQRAGTPSPCWLPSFVPIAVGVAADYLMVDTRPGPRHGVLRQWEGEDGASAGPRPSLDKLVSDTASCLERGKAFRQLIPEVVEGGLQWQDADHPARARPPSNLPPQWQGFLEQFREYRIAVWNDDGTTWGEDLRRDQVDVESSAQERRYQLMDLILAELDPDPHDYWNGHRAEALDDEQAELRRLAPALSSDLSRRRTTELLQLITQLRELMRHHPLQT